MAWQQLDSAESGDGRQYGALRPVARDRCTKPTPLSRVQSAVGPLALLKVLKGLYALCRGDMTVVANHGIWDSWVVHLIVNIIGAIRSSDGLNSFDLDGGPPWDPLKSGAIVRPINHCHATASFDLAN